MFQTFVHIFFHISHTSYRLHKHLVLNYEIVPLLSDIIIFSLQLSFTLQANKITMQINTDDSLPKKYIKQF